MDQEQNLDMTNFECFAVVWAVIILRRCLKMCRVIRTKDHHASQLILNLAVATERYPGRLSFLDYNFEIVHTAGVKHQAAGAQLRLPTAGSHNIKIEDRIRVWR